MKITMSILTILIINQALTVSLFKKMLFNSMIESFNKHIKYYSLFKNELKVFEDTVTYLSTSVPDYNNKPHGRLYGLTPNEILNGNIPVKDNYQQDMIKAKQNRLKQNRLIACCEKNYIRLQIKF